MGALFHQMKNKNIESDKALYTVTAEETVYSMLMKDELEEATIFNKELYEAIEGFSYGIEDNNNKLVYEAMGDFRKVMDDSFKRQIKAFNKLGKNTLDAIIEKYNALKALCVKYQHQLVDGVKYTKGHEHFNLSGRVDIRYIDEYILMIKDHLYQIKNASDANIRTVYTRCMNDVTNKSYLDMIRGKLIGTIPISQSDFQEECMKYFLGGKTRVQIITVNTNKIFALYQEVRHLKGVISDIRLDMENVKISIIDFHKALRKQDKDVTKYLRESGIPNLFGNMGFEEFLGSYDKATLRYISKALTTLKEIWLIYKVFFSCKVEAINSAVRNYTNFVKVAYIGGELK